MTNIRVANGLLGFHALHATKNSMHHADLAN